MALASYFELVPLRIHNQREIKGCRKTRHVLLWVSCRSSLEGWRKQPAQQISGWLMVSNDSILHTEASSNMAVPPYRAGGYQYLKSSILAHRLSTPPQHNRLSTTGLRTTSPPLLHRPIRKVLFSLLRIQSGLEFKEFVLSFMISSNGPWRYCCCATENE